MRETVTRSLSGIVYVLLLTVAIFFSQESFLLLFGMFLIIAVIEFCDLIALKSIYPIIIGVIAYSVFAFFPSSELTHLLLLIGALFVSVKCIRLLFENKRQTSDTTSKYVYLIGYIVIPFILLSKLPFRENGYEPKIIMSIFILIWTNDTFAFIVGKSIGKNKLFERISPKKTIEGFIGGLGFSIVISLILARFFIHESILIWVCIAVIVGVFGTIGDLVESKFKRMAMVKDSGTIMPGHGGILDRLDSIIFAAPFVFLFYQILNYVS